ncbi:MAG: hypothetical protein GC200_06525 [Tepidisphaera sp.]|nr:hypothetical protein [Tepidisphaera sp.]
MKSRACVLVMVAGASVAMGQSLDLSRAYEAELRADAVARESLLGESSCGYDDGKFTISDGGNNTLRLGGVIQTRWEANFRQGAGSPDNFTNGFSLRRARLDATGTIFDKRLSYDVRIESSRTNGNFSPLEVFGRYALSEEWYVRAGQFKVPLNREEVLSTTMQLAIERSVVDAVFAESYSQGAEVGYQGQDARAFLAVGDGLKTTTSDYTSAAEADYAVTGRAEFKWAGKGWKWANDFTSFRGSEYAAMAGLAGHWQAGGDTGGTANIDFFQGEADVQVEGDGWNFFAAGIWRSSRRPGLGTRDDFGAIVQGGVFVSDQAEIFARWDGVFPDDANGDAFNTLTAGVNYYVSPHSQAVKLTWEFGYFFNSTTANTLVKESTQAGLLTSTEPGEWMLQGQVQVMF